MSVINLGLPDEHRPTQIKRQRIVGMKMVRTFFSTSGDLATVVQEDQKTVIAKWYAEVCLPKIFKKIQEKQPRTWTAKNSAPPRQ